MKPIRCLVLFQSPSLRGSGRFGPMTGTPTGRRSMSQSPSLRGSGRFGCGPTPNVFAEKSQSPSLRGSGRFSRQMPSRCSSGSGLNPLHCGAVVASSAEPRASCCARSSQSPSLRGSGRFTTMEVWIPWIAAFVSIPFIAGQWSLPAGSRAPSRALRRGLNPLHCGAVVASPAAWRRGKEDVSLNPLHCGAVVASHGPGASRETQQPGFNPLHCGAVVASRTARARRSARSVSIPFIAGQWSLPEEQARREAAARVSIPFIAGQWSLRAVGELVSWMDSLFQSPSLRGSGRFP